MDAAGNALRIPAAVRAGPCNAAGRAVYLSLKIMRIVYDYGITEPRIPHARPSEKGQRETVVVISEKKANAGAAGKDGISIAGTDYEASISGEALARDREVRAHENAHLAALGGAAASGILYDTATGPGGESIAVGGKIAVDLAEVPGDPAATLRKARSVIAAANAPNDPSAADQRTAARAYELYRKAAEDLRISRGN